MICPMKFNMYTLRTIDGSVKEGTCECEESKCAWWNKYTSECKIGQWFSLTVKEMKMKISKIFIKNKQQYLFAVMIPIMQDGVSNEGLLKS